LFYVFKDFGLDGMRCDINGNLYVCRYDAGKIVVIDPEGNIIRQIILKGKKPSNITFGGKDKKQCFVTMADRGCFESFYSEYPGKDF
jgi:sugar lactone lactonase YvrE